MKIKKLRLLTAVIMSIIMVCAMSPSMAFADTITVDVTVKNTTFTRPLINLSGNTVRPAWTGNLFASSLKVPVEDGENLSSALSKYCGGIVVVSNGYVSGFNRLNSSINIEKPKEWDEYDMSGFQFRVNGKSPQLTYGGAGPGNMVNKEEIDPDNEAKLNNGDKILFAYSIDGTEIDAPYIKTPVKVKFKALKTRSIKLSWQKIDKATGYDVYRATKKKGKYKKIGTAKTNSYVDKSLKSGKVYYYKIKMIRNQNSGDFSKITYATPKPAKPKVKVTKSGRKSLKISWKKVAGAKKYQIYKAKSKNGKYKKVKTVSAKKSSYINKKLKSGKKYYYKVRAVSKAGKKYVKSDFSKRKSNRAK